MIRNIRYIFIPILIGIFFFSCTSKINLINNGASRYTIVIPNYATDTETYAAKELQKYFKMVSDIKLPIIKDTIPKTECEILIGKTNRINKSFDFASLKKDGFKIETTHNSILIMGGDKKGTLYGTYTFLEKFLKIKMYAPDVIDFTKIKNLKIPQIDITEIPAFEYRELHLPSAHSSKEFCEWHKLTHLSERKRDFGSFVHTLASLVPAEKYFKNHPEYFSEINGIRIPNQQVCLTNPNVLKVVINNLKEKMEKKPQAIVWDVSQNDNFGNCMCANCRKSDSLYGSAAGTMIAFVNEIAKTFPDKIISTLAYQYTRKAPVKIKPSSNVMVVLCTIECNRNKSISEMENDLFNRDIKEWNAITEKLKIWDYVIQFTSLINPFPNFHVLKPNLQLFKQNGVKYLFEQGSREAKSDMDKLKAYTLAKLMWNPELEHEKIVDEFIFGYYGNAGKYIKEYFQTLHNAVKKSEEPLIIYGYPYQGIKSYLTPNLLDKYSLLFDKAAISVKDDTTLSNRVNIARLSLEYTILEISKLNAFDNYKMFETKGKTISVNPKIRERLSFFNKWSKKGNVKALHEMGFSPEEYSKKMEKYLSEGMQIHKAYGKKVELKSSIHPKYYGKGTNTLTDGIIGENNYFFNWLGFEANELEAIIDLEKPTTINSIGINFLQEVKSWIWLPHRVDYFISSNGKDFKKIGSVKKKTDERQKGIFTETFTLKINRIKSRYIKVKTKSFINCPKWHIGYDNGKGKAFIFADEIIIK